MEQNDYGSISIATTLSTLGMNMLQHHLVLSDLTSFNVTGVMEWGFLLSPNGQTFLVSEWLFILKFILMYTLW